MQTETYKPAIALYNVQHVCPDLLKDNFVVRLRQYDKIWPSIETSKMDFPEQCFIVQGVSGAGKTTLLSRLAIA
jgi:putative ribosome biogenesis GTPase RsgA